MSNATIATAGLAVLAGTTLQAGAAGDDPLARYRWTDRVVVALAATAADPDLARQRRIFQAMRAGARDRDLVLVEAVDPTPEGAALRRRFGGSGFRAVLIGKDGGAKLDADRPLGPDDLFPLIDAMPMRQDEIGRKR